MAEQVIDLGFRPRPWQVKALSSMRRFSVLVVHRRGGKTVAAVMKLIDSALRSTHAAPRFAYIAPELKQAKDVAWAYLRSYASKVPGTRVHESELWVEFPNKARIRLYGADDPDALRGAYLDGVVLDEVAQLKSYVWGEVLLPMLADHSGWALFIGTPKGTNLLSERYFAAQGDPEWYADLFDIDATGAISNDELQVIRKEMTTQQWRQEMLCDFNASGDDALISIELVRDALGRHLKPPMYDFAGKALGIDVALGGGDKTVFQPRQGLAAFKPDVFDLKDPRQIGDLAAAKIDSWKPDVVFVDGSGGYGAGVISRLTELGYTPVEVQFGGSPRDARFANKRTEMWWDIKCWLEQGGALPRMNEYLLDLTAPQYDHKNAAGKMALESKDKMRSRGIKSPDYGDALALTFATPIPAKPVQIPGLGFYTGLIGAHQNTATNYDPWDRYAKELEKAHG